MAVIGDAIGSYFEDRCSQQAAGISYRLLFSIAPLAIVLVSAFGLVLQDEDVRKAVVETLVDTLPVSAGHKQDVESALSAIARPASATGLLSLVVFAWAATGVMSALRQGLERAMGVTEGRPAARGKLIDFGLIVGAALLLLIAALATLLDNVVQRASGPVESATGIDVAGGLLRLTSFLLSIGIVLLLYRFVPARGIRFRDGLAGAIVSAVLFQAIALLSNLGYGQATQLSVIYGALTSVLLFLYAMYLYSAALLFGAEVATAWAKPPSTGPHVPLTQQLRRALLGLFVTQKPPPDERPREDRTS